MLAAAAHYLQPAQLLTAAQTVEAALRVRHGDS